MEIPISVSGRVVTPRGVHLHPNGLHNYWMDPSRRDYWLDLLVDMSMSWVLALSESDNLRISGAAEALLDAGVIPIVRFGYQFPRPWTHHDETAQLAELYAQYGAPLVVQFANEPFDPREWRNGEVPPFYEAWAIVSQRWREMAALTIERGAYPGFPDGPCYDINPFSIPGTSQWWAEDKAVYLGHHYGKGRPVDFPTDEVSWYGTPLSWEQYLADLDDFQDDPHWNEGPGVLALMNEQRIDWAEPGKTALDDDVCWRGWQKVQHYAYREFGRPVQMAMTEGGWVPRDRAGSGPIDIRWPYTTPRKVAEKILQMYADAPSFKFAVCPWLLADGDMAGGDVGWPFDSWVTWAFEDKYGREKPIVQALKDNPPGRRVERLGGRNV